MVAKYWEGLGKGDDYVLVRNEYQALVETLEPDSKPLDDETMDEVSLQTNMESARCCSS